MGGIRELLDGKIWEWVLSFRWEWEWDGNGNEVIEMGGNWYEKFVPAHLYPEDRARGAKEVWSCAPSEGAGVEPLLTSWSIGAFCVIVQAFS